MDKLFVILGRAWILGRFNALDVDRQKNIYSSLQINTFTYKNV